MTSSAASVTWAVYLASGSLGSAAPVKHPLFWPAHSLVAAKSTYCHDEVVEASEDKKQTAPMYMLID